MPIKFSDLQPHELYAFAKLGDTDNAELKKARKVLRDGKKYPLDFTIHVHGELTVGHASSATFGKQLSATILAAMLLEQFGPRKRKQIAKQIAASVNDPEIVLADIVDADAIATAEQLVADTTEKSAGTRKGAVRANVTVAKR